MNSIDEKPKRYSRPFYTRPSCLGAMVLVFLACFGATTITISRNEDVKGTWVADFCRIVSVVLNRPKDACSDSSTGSNGDLTLVALQATQTKLAQPVSSTTPLPTIDTSASQTLQAIQATQTAMSIRPTATQTTDTSVTQTLAAIAATQTAMSVRPTATQTTDTSMTQTLVAIAATQTAMSVRPTATQTTDTSVTQTLAAIGATQTAMSVLLSPTSQAVDVVAPSLPALAEQQALRPQTTQNFGTGPFSQAMTSDGQAQLTDPQLVSDYWHFTRIRLQENPNACGTLQYDASKVWFAGSKGTTFSVNGSPVGKLTRATGSHGIVINYSVKKNEQLCASGYDPFGFLIFTGPDMYYHYDSYCYRKYCT